MKKLFRNKKGFALLYAILLAGAVLTVGVILMNIVTRQLVYSSTNRSSEDSYYSVANSGRECLDYYLNKSDTPFYSVDPDSLNFVYPGNVSVSCMGKNITLNRRDFSSNGKPFISYVSQEEDVAGGKFKMILSVNLNQKCLEDLSPVPKPNCRGTNSLDRAWAIVKAEGGNVGSRETKRAAVTAFVY